VRKRAERLPAGLCRVDHDNSNVHLWRVQHRGGKFTYFGDSKYGGVSESLAAALIYLLGLPVIGGYRKKMRTNSTGIGGVAPINYRGKIRAYKAYAGSSRTKLYQAVFPLSQYADDEAIARAEAARSEFCKMIEEAEKCARDKMIKRMLAKLQKRRR
jgi:hypothetical protein